MTTVHLLAIQKDVLKQVDLCYQKKKRCQFFLLKEQLIDQLVDGFPRCLEACLASCPSGVQMLTGTNSPGTGEGKKGE